jgi:hypothetical protein
MKICVIGGGIFGVSIALTLSNNDYDVSLFECNEDILLNASKNNHNRIHFGFHYPRSKETAEQSLNGYDIFYKNFSNCLINDFNHYYLIEKNGKVTTSEFKEFCKNLKLDFSEKYPNDIEINLKDIDSSFLTNEPIFDIDQIRFELNQKLLKSNVKVFFNKKIENIEDVSEYDVVINTTYYNINNIKKIFGLPPIKLKFQDVIIPYFKYNSKRFGVTVMDGEYCSVLPKGFSSNEFLLYHVKNSVINELIGYNLPKDWVNYDIDYTNEKIDDIYITSMKYYPFLKNCEKISYFRTIRTLPINNNDERLSTLEINQINDKKIITLISGKITTCWLIGEKILKILNENNINR